MKNSKERVYYNTNGQTSDQRINKAKQCGNYDYTTDPGVQKDGFLGIDDLDRIRRRKLK